LPHRTFKDLFGRTWDVWEVVPTGLIKSADGQETESTVSAAPPRHSRRAISGALSEGWLAFQWDHERRRLAPIPEDWVGLDDDALQRLLERSAPAGKLRRLVE